ncbi:FAD-dependent oxidoreductase [Streptomyces pathocidini]|uniref:FAD-dependent oxidoreductase n=1 Tax=Streptomyces pathocidini TaxID=1650571 RepID=UPI000A967748|nr:FAD-dependent oxidoreductase [Streptomyces pathocidini]
MNANSEVIVIGAGISGLLAARVLANSCETVTIIERDRLSQSGQVRPGVPQGSHIHGLLARGHEAIEDLVPGFAEDLLADGAASVEFLSETRISYQGYTLLQSPADISMAFASRPFIESRIARKVLALPNVRLLDGHTVQALTATPHGDRITGVQLATPDGERVKRPATLVVAALGKAGQALSWLDRLGYPRPKESRMRIDVGYASRHYQLPADVLGKDRFFFDGPHADRPCGLMIGVQENGTWIVTACGYGAHAPHRTGHSFHEVVARLAPAGVAERLAASPALDDIHTFGFPASTRRHYERISRMPEGLIAFGDAVCSYNPIYGIGMTSAALQAKALASTLEAGGRRLPQRFYRRAAPNITLLWTLSSTMDHLISEVPGRRPLHVQLVAPFLKRLLATAEYDPEMARTVARVVTFAAPLPGLLHPRLLVRVLHNRHDARENPVVGVRDD